MDHCLNEVTVEIQKANKVQSITIENSEEAENTTVHLDQRVWVKPQDELFTEIKEEIPECEFQTIVDVKDEIEEQDEQVEEEEIKINPTIICEPIEPPPTIDIPLPKVPIPKLSRINANIKVKKPRGRVGRRPRPILPMTRSIVPASTPHMDQPSTPHQIIMPPPQMPGIAYQIFLGDHGKNANNSVQYTMLQPQPVFLQQTPTSVTSQPSMVINQSYSMTQGQLQPPTKISKIAPKLFGQSYCAFCYKLFKNVNEHIKDCLLNPDSKNYKFRKIAPSNPLN